MKINKLYIKIIPLIAILGITGCTDWLDVKPESQIILENYWKNETDVQAVLASCYKALTVDDAVYRMIVWGELRSDNMTSGTGFANSRYDMQKMLNGDLTPDNAFAKWGSFYNVINYCNTVLHYAPVVINRDNNFTTDDLHRVQAEAMSVRALAYFYLVRSFRDVPYVTQASIEDTQEFNVAKTDGSVIIDSLIMDLKYAQKYAISEYGTKANNKGRFTLNAVNSLLADIYLWKASDTNSTTKIDDLNNCIEACNLVLSDNKLKLLDGTIMYSQVFSVGNSSESILELQFDDKQQVNNPVNNLYGYSGDNYGEIALPTTLGYDYEDKIAGANSPFGYKLTSSITESATDIRARDFLNVNMGRSSGKYFIFKYGGRLCTELTGTGGISLSYYYRNNTANWIIYRLSDIILMKAEALTQLDGQDNLKLAVTCVNKTYMRSNDGQDSLRFENYASQPEVEKLVLRERQRELMFEGKRWFDLVRVARRDKSVNSLNDYINHKASGTTGTSTAQTLDAMYMPVAKSELEANSKLKQNPFYEQTTSTSIR